MAKSKERRTWVLDTETKGTGAEVVSLEKLEQRKRAAQRRRGLSVVRPESAVRRERESTAEEAEQRGPRRFRLVHALTGQLLAEDVSAREAVELLGEIKTVIDVHVYLWEPESASWRPLTFAEKQALWRFRGRGG